MLQISQCCFQVPGAMLCCIGLGLCLFVCACIRLGACFLWLCVAVPLRTRFGVVCGSPGLCVCCVVSVCVVPGVG